MKKLILLLLCVGFILCIFGGGAYLLQKIERDKPIFLQIHTSTDDILLETDSKDIQKLVEQFNENTVKYEQMITPYSPDLEYCIDIAPSSNFAIEIDSDYNVFSDNKYISVCILRTIVNSCTGENEAVAPDYFIYDVEDKKILSQQEIKDKEQIRDEKIEENLFRYYTSIDENLGSAIPTKVEDVVVYYHKSGKFYMTFYDEVFKSYTSFSID